MVPQVDIDLTPDDPPFNPALWIKQNKKFSLTGTRPEVHTQGGAENPAHQQFLRLFRDIPDKLDTF